MQQKRQHSKNGTKKRKTNRTRAAKQKGVEWKDVVGYEGIYQVSSNGHVRSLDRDRFCVEDSRRYVLRGKILKPQLKNTGYLMVNLYKNRKMRSLSIHRLVIEAFKSPVPERKECNHIDGNKLNNNIENLEWVTKKENVRHAVKTGLINQPKGKDSPCWIDGPVCASTLATRKHVLKKRGLL